MYSNFHQFLIFTNFLSCLVNKILKIQSWSKLNFRKLAQKIKNLT